MNYKLYQHKQIVNVLVLMEREIKFIMHGKNDTRT